MDVAPEAAPPVDPRTTTNLEGFWGFNQQPPSGNTLTDSAGNVATLVNVTWNTTDHAPGQTTGPHSLAFDGTQSYVRAEITPMPKSEGPKTIAVWIRNRTTSTTALTDLISLYHSKEQLNYGIQLGLNGTKVAMWRFGQNPEMTAPNSLPNDTWHHAAYTFEAGLHILYQDGQEVRRINANNAPMVAGTVDRVVIGTYLGKDLRTFELFKGSMNDVRIYTRALRPDEVMALANPP